MRIHLVQDPPFSSVNFPSHYFIFFLSLGVLILDQMEKGSVTICSLCPVFITLGLFMTPCTVSIGAAWWDFALNGKHDYVCTHTK